MAWKFVGWKPPAAGCGKDVGVNSVLGVKELKGIESVLNDSEVETGAVDASDEGLNSLIYPDGVKGLKKHTLELIKVLECFFA